METPPAVRPPRCSYVSPDGLAAVDDAIRRGGVTDGDLRMLTDRFGCRAEVRWHAYQERGEGLSLHACADHLGHLIGNHGWSVDPVAAVAPDPYVTITLTPVTGGPSLQSFGAPTLLGPQPAATPVIDFGLNPTREQVAAHGFSDDSKAYREALAAFDAPPICHLCSTKLAPNATCRCITTPHRLTYSATGVILDREFCARVRATLVTAWRCNRCDRDLRMESPIWSTLQPHACCGAVTEQIRLDALTATISQGRSDWGASVLEAAYPAIRAAAAWIDPAHDASRETATAILTDAVNRTMTQLMTTHDLIPATDEGYRMVHVAIAKTLGVSCNAVEIEVRPPGFRVTWNGAYALWPLVTAS